MKTLHLAVTTAVGVVFLVVLGTYLLFNPVWHMPEPQPISKSDMYKKLIDAATNLPVAKAFLAKYPYAQTSITYYNKTGEQAVLIESQETPIIDTITKHYTAYGTISLVIPLDVSNYVIDENGIKMRCVMLYYNDSAGIDYLLYPTSDYNRTLENIVLNNNCFDASIIPTALPAKILGSVPKMYATVEQGNATEFTFPLGFDGRYRSELIQISGTMSPGIKTWAFPPQISGNLSQIMTVGINVDHDAMPRKYMIPINGSGWVENHLTDTKAYFGNVTLGEIYLTVTPHSSPITMTLGKVLHNFRSFCVEENSCASGPTNDYALITVSSKIPTKVRLNISGLDGGWAKMLPDVIEAKPNGTTVRLITAGFSLYDSPIVDATNSVMVTASTGDMHEATILGIQGSGKPAVIHGDDAISLDDNMVFAGDGGWLTTEAIVVYDPNDNSTSLPVKLGVLGMVDGNSTIPLPSWLSIIIPTSKFLLNATQPYYIPVGIITHDAPLSGTYTLLISEDVGQRHFVVPQKITIAPLDVP